MKKLPFENLACCVLPPSWCEDPLLSPQLPATNSSQLHQILINICFGVCILTIIFILGIIAREISKRFIEVYFQIILLQIPNNVFTYI